MSASWFRVAQCGGRCFIVAEPKLERHDVTVDALAGWFEVADDFQNRQRRGRVGGDVMADQPGGDGEQVAAGRLAHRGDPGVVDALGQRAPVQLVGPVRSARARRRSPRAEVCRAAARWSPRLVVAPGGRR